MYYTPLFQTPLGQIHIHVLLLLQQRNVFYLDPLKIHVVRYPSGVKEGDNIQICLQTNWEVVTESVHIYVETTHTSGYTPPAIGKTDI